MTSAVSTPAGRHRHGGHRTPARRQSRHPGVSGAVPDLLGLLEDGLALLLLADVEEVRVQLLVLVVHLKEGAAVRVHQVFCIYLGTHSETRVSP